MKRVLSVLASHEIAPLKPEMNSLYGVESL